MKTLILLRHAKTESDAVDDWHRSLTDRGREQALSMGEVLVGLGLPERVAAIHSPALRAAQTWEQIAPALGPGVDVRPTPAVYDADEDDLLQVLREIDEDEDTVLLVGHNPGMSYLATLLTGDELPDDDSVTKDGALRTCRGVALEYDGLWCDIDSGDATAQRYLAPKVD